MAEPILLRAPREGIPPLIDSEDDLAQAADALARSTQPVAVDTERAQGHRYGGGAYLVQIRKDDVGSFLVDPSGMRNLEVLAGGLKGTWILHAADQDLRCLADLGLSPQALFDTEVAARLLGYERFSLGALTEQVLGIALEKSHQNEDWSLRPLPTDWLRYAALDVELLHELQMALTARLEETGRLEWAQQEFHHELTHPLVVREPNWRDLKGLGKVRTREGLAVARELWTAREELAKETDLAPGRILAAAGIVAAAQSVPRSKGKLSAIEAFRRPRARRELSRWWDALARARALRDSELPPLRLPPDPNHVPAAASWKRADPDAWERLQTMRALVSRAAAPLGVAPDVVLQPRVQRDIAWRPLTGPLPDALEGAGARAWQVEQLEQFVEPGDLKSLRS